MGKTEIKYLSFILDNIHLWNKHELVWKKSLVCRNFSGKKNWNATHKNSLKIRPIITYVSIAWSKRTNPTTARNNLSKLQKLAWICVTEAIRTCSTAAVGVELDLVPLHIVVERIANRITVRKANLPKLIKFGICFGTICQKKFNTRAGLE